MRELTQYQSRLLEKISDDRARVIGWDRYARGPVVRLSDGHLCTITRKRVVHHGTTTSADRSDGTRG